MGGPISILGLQTFIPRPFLRAPLGAALLLAITRFEKARIIGARALQIAMGAPILMDDAVGVVDPMTIAMREFERGHIPITVKRLVNAVH